MNRTKIALYRRDPMAFFGDLIVPTINGPRKFRDVWAPFQIERFEMMAAALVDVAQGRPPDIGRFWWEATKGASKDSDLACCLLCLLAFATRALRIQVAAADQEQADEMRRAAVDILRLNPWLAEWVTAQNWRLTCKANGATADIQSADVSGSHGSRPDVVILNELSHVTRREFVENLADNATKRKGLLIVGTNAGHTGTWQHNWRQIAEDSDRWRMHVWDKPAPWVDAAEIAEAERRNSRARFLRLFYGKWVSGSGDALDPADVEAAIGTINVEGRQRGFAFAAGLDLGTKRDHSAFVVVGRDTEGRLFVPLVMGWAPYGDPPRVDLEAVEDCILEANARFRLSSVAYDPHQAAYLAQRLVKRRVRMKEYTFAGKNLDLLASTLLEQFRSRNVIIPNDADLLSDLGNVSIEDRPFGHKLVASTDESGSHADRAIALALGMVAVRDAKVFAGTWGAIPGPHPMYGEVARELGTDYRPGLAPPPWRSLDGGISW